MVSHKTRDPYMGSPKSGVRVRVSREFEREGEAMDAVREKLREREKSRERERGKAQPC
jgi:cytidylate kinase